MATSPRVLEFIEELWSEWEEDLQAWAESKEFNVQDKMQDRLNKLVDALGPPKQKGQQQFIDKVKDFIQHDVGNTGSPFFSGLDKLQREQTTVFEQKLKEAETLEKAEEITRKFTASQGFTVTPAPNNRLKVSDISPQVQTGELAKRGEIAKELEDAVRERAVELEQEKLNQIKDEEEIVADKLINTATDRWQFVAADIVDVVNAARSLRDLDVVRNDIARLPINSRRYAERLVGLKRQELS